MKETIRKFKETVEIRSSVFNRIRSHRYFPVTVLFCALLTAACIHIWQRVKVVELVKEVSLLRKENVSLLDDKKKTYSDIAALSMACRVERYAADTLGLRAVSADRLFTLVRDNEPDISQPDDLDLMLSAINRVASFVPVISENQATAGTVGDLDLDSASTGGGE